MTKVNIISGFLGAGKTTLIKKLLSGAFGDEKVVLLENEYGEVGIDGGFMKDSGIQVTELNSGCICCTLVGDFADALAKLIDAYHPDRILIEPSGVGKLSDIRKVVLDCAESHDLQLTGCATVADVSKCRMYAKNFGEFFIDQIQSAETIILSRTQTASQERIDKTVELLRQYNERARIITTPWDELEPKKILDTIESPDFLLTVDELMAGHEDDDDDDECGCGHHHHDHDEHGHATISAAAQVPATITTTRMTSTSAAAAIITTITTTRMTSTATSAAAAITTITTTRMHGHECGCGHHHHDHDHQCGCGHHHHGHHADEVFENIGVETPKKFDEAAIRAALEQLEDEHRFGSILRAKGILPLSDGKWLHFDYVPGESDLRYGPADYTGRLCVIGVHINEDALKELFGI